MRLSSFFILLCSSLLSFSQKGVNTKKFPYQVLFADQVSVFGKEVKQFDYLTNEDHLIVEGSVTIFHYSGKMFELTSGEYWTNELVINKPKRSIFRPILDPVGKYKYPYSPKDLAKRCLSYYGVELILPDEEELYYGKDQAIELFWILSQELGYNDDYIFKIEFRNLFDEILRTVTTNDFSFSFKVDTLDHDKLDTVDIYGGLLIFSVSIEEKDQYSTGDIGIKIIEDEQLYTKEKDKNYIGLRDAIYYDYINENRRAQVFYKYQIRKSKQDPRFIQLYEGFLERNPQFKANTE